MSRYSQITSETWMDDEFLKLSITGKLMYLYLLTSPHSNIAGFFRISIKQIAADMDIDEDKIKPELLGQKKLWLYDEEFSQVFIPNYLKYNRLYNEKQYKAINNQIMPLKKSRLHMYFLHAVNKHLGSKALEYIDKEILVYAREQARMEETPVGLVIYNLINKYI